jgi:hypothetical protein
MTVPNIKVVITIIILILNLNPTLISSSVRRKKSPYLDWDILLFGNKGSSLQKLLENANKTTERATKFINKIKSRTTAISAGC